MDARARVAESRWRLSLPEWGLVACFFYTLLSYPFYLKYVAYSAYQTGFVAFLLAVIVFFVVEPRVLPVGRTALLQPPIALGVALYGVYVLAVGVASLLNAGEGYLIAELGRLLVKAVLGVAFVACVSERERGVPPDGPPPQPFPIDAVHEEPRLHAGRREAQPESRRSRIEVVDPIRPRLERLDGLCGESPGGHGSISDRAVGRSGVTPG